MTENETKAVKFIQNIKDDAVVTLDHIAKEEPNVIPLVYKGRKEKASTILAMVGELLQYRAIGTTEECRAAAGKQAARMKDGITECCGYDFGTDQFDTDIRFCPKCGRKLNWSDEE